MNDDFGFFDDDDRYTDRRSASRSASRGSHRGGRRSRTAANDSRSRFISRLAALTGTLAVAVGAFSAAHELAPNIIDPDGKVPGRYIALAAAILVACTFLLIILARVVLPRNTSHHGVASGGIITLVVSLLMLVLGVSVGVLFPQGLIQPRIRDVAPIESNAQMEQGIDQAAGACESGWSGLDSGGYPGITTVEMCPDTRVAFVSFDTDASAAMSKALLESKIAEVLAQHSEDERAQGDWRLLSGGQWVVFGNADQMTALQQLWGGTLEQISAVSDGGTQ